MNAVVTSSTSLRLLLLFHLFQPLPPSPRTPLLPRLYLDTCTFIESLGQNDARVHCGRHPLSHPRIHTRTRVRARAYTFFLTVFRALMHIFFARTSSCTRVYIFSLKAFIHTHIYAFVRTLGYAITTRCLRWIVAWRIIIDTRNYRCRTHTNIFIHKHSRVSNPKQHLRTHNYQPIVADLYSQRSVETQVAVPSYNYFFLLFLLQI